MTHERVALEPCWNVPDRIHSFAPLLTLWNQESLPSPQPKKKMFQQGISTPTSAALLLFVTFFSFLRMALTVCIRILSHDPAVAPVRQLADGARAGIPWEEARGRISWHSHNGRSASHVVLRVVETL